MSWVTLIWSMTAGICLTFAASRSIRSRIPLLLQSLLPGLDGIDLGHPQHLEHAVEANVRWSMRQLIETPEARARVAEGRMKLVGAVCDIATGRVRPLA